jgi:hypothetical protein
MNDKIKKENSITKIIVKFTSRDFKIAVSDETTISEMIFKIRKYLKIKPEEAIFLFFERKSMFRIKEVIYPSNKTVGEIKHEHGEEILKVNVMRENCFGMAWNKAFVKARIQERKGLFVSIITWSYYGLYHYEEVQVHDSLNEATEHLLKVRCDGKLSLETEKK